MPCSARNDDTWHEREIRRARSFENAVAHHLAGRANAAIASDPTLAPAMNNLGALLGACGLTTEALELFRRAVAVDATYAGRGRENRARRHGRDFHGRESARREKRCGA